MSLNSLLQVSDESLDEILKARRDLLVWDEVINLLIKYLSIIINLKKCGIVKDKFHREYFHLIFFVESY